MPKDTIGELSQYQAGTPLDRVALAARRNQKPMGLAGYSQKGTPAPVAAGKPKVDKWAEVAARLWTKAIPAQVEVSPGVYAFAKPGPGLIGYGQIPSSIAKKVGVDQPVIGWNPKDLDKEESFLLNQLVAMRQKEVEQQATAQNMEPDDE